MKRIILLFGGWLFVTLGAIGVVVPLLPTTPFLLLAAYCFSKSSERFHRMLLEHKLFGPIIKDWHTHGVISASVKWTSTVMMLVMISYPLVFVINSNMIRSLVVLTMLCVMVFIWSRPSFKL